MAAWDTLLVPSRVSCSGSLALAIAERSYTLRCRLLRQTEVQNLRRSHEDIGGLNIAMHDAICVGTSSARAISITTDIAITKAFLSIRCFQRNAIQRVLTATA